MTTYVPALSITGWAGSPEDKAYYLFAHFYESEKNQTQVYGKNVTNLQWLCAQFEHDIPEFCGQLRKDLSKYLQRYYDQVEIDTTHNDNKSNPGSIVKVTVSSTVYVDGIKYSFGHLVEKNGKIAKLLTLVNGTYI